MKRYLQDIYYLHYFIFVLYIVFTKNSVNDSLNKVIWQNLFENEINCEIKI